MSNPTYDIEAGAVKRAWLSSYVRSDFEGAVLDISTAQTQVTTKYTIRCEEDYSTEHTLARFFAYDNILEVESDWIQEEYSARTNDALLAWRELFMEAIEKEGKSRD